MYAFRVWVLVFIEKDCLKLFQFYNNNNNNNNNKNNNNNNGLLQVLPLKWHFACKTENYIFTNKL